MRYLLAGAVALAGVVLVGLAYHNTAGEAWQALLAAPATPQKGS